MGPSNISFLSFRVIFHWTMIIREKGYPPLTRHPTKKETHLPKRKDRLNQPQPTRLISASRSPGQGRDQGDSCLWIALMREWRIIPGRIWIGGERITPHLFQPWKYRPVRPFWKGTTLNLRAFGAGFPYSIYHLGWSRLRSLVGTKKTLALDTCQIISPILQMTWK